MSVPLASTSAPPPWCHPGERDGREPIGEAAAPVSPYGSTERITAFEDTMRMPSFEDTVRMPSFEDTAPMPSFENGAPEPDSARPAPVSGEDITQPIRVNRSRVPMARA